MSIRIYNQEAFMALQSHARQNSPTKPLHQDHEMNSECPNISVSFGSNKFSSLTRSTATAAEDRVRNKHEKFQKEQAELEKKVKELTAANIRKAQAKKDAQFAKLTDELTDAEKLAEELQQRIDLHDASEERRKKKLHLEWVENVFDKVNAPINKQLGSMKSEDLNRRRRDAYQRFLDTTNKKGALFRDIIIENEYSPLTDNPAIQCKVNVDDPCRRPLQRREEEDAIAHRGECHPKKNYCRSDNLDTKLWSTGIFESTPHGYFNKIMNSTSSERKSTTYASNVNFDHYNVCTGSEVVLAEMPRGKRTDFGFKIKAASTQLCLGDEN